MTQFSNKNQVGLNMNVIKNKPSKNMSTKEALSDVEKINWSEDVKNGSRKVKVDKLKK